MGRYGDMDYARWAKSGFFLGVGLLALGAGGEILGRIVFGTLPGWEHRLFLYSEGLGVLVGLFSVLIFGIFLPLTE